jgi:Leucine-rich repeat (LRR) protein
MSVLFPVLSHFEIAAQQPQDYKDQVVVLGDFPRMLIGGAISKETYQTLCQNSAQTKVTFEAAIKAVNESSSVETSDILKLIEILSTYKLFQCSNPIEALIYLEPLIQTQVVFRQAAQELFFPQTILSKVQLQEALWVGVYLGELSFVKQAIHLGADINAPIYPKMTALLLACSKTSEPVARYLVEQGAEVRFVGGTNHHKTPLSAALVHGRFSQDFIHILTEKDGGFSLQFHKRKMIAHLFSRMTATGDSQIGPTKFALWGYRLLPALENYLETAEYFYRQTDWLDQVISKVSHLLSEETRLQLANPEIKARLHKIPSQLMESMACALKWEKQKGSLTSKERREQFLEQAFERLDAGQPAMCLGLTQTSSGVGIEQSLHAWGMVAMRDAEDSYNVKFCNRASEHFPGIITRKMTRDELSCLWGDFQDATDWKRDFNGELGEEFWNAISDSFHPFRENRIKETKQAIGNCCFYSVQSFELGELDELFGQILSNKDDVEILSKTTKGLRTHLAKGFSVRGYLENASTCASSSQEVIGSDNDLLASIYFRSFQHPKLTHVSEAFIGFEPTFDLLLRNESLRAAWPKMRIELYKLLKISDSLPSEEASPEEVRVYLANEENRSLIEQVKGLDFSITPFYGLKKNLLVFPEELHLFKGLEKLILKGNELKILPPLSFPILKELDLSSNQLQCIPTLDLPELKTLSLENNQLNSVPNLAHTSKLEVLNLGKNKLQTTHSTYPASLKELSLVLNRLERVDLPYLPNLTTLRLSSNPLKAIPPLLTPRLKTLNLDSTQLSDPTAEEITLLSQLISLEWLNLSNNLLTQPLALSLPNLENLNLYGNPITASSQDNGASSSS